MSYELRAVPDPPWIPPDERARREVVIAENIPHAILELQQENEALKDRLQALEQRLEWFFSHLARL